MVDKHVIVVGAGPGGLTSAMLLASRGFKVTVLEKAPVVGGRNAAINLGDFKFDTGPTFLMMKFVLDDVFRAAGRKSEDYLKFKSLEPMYQLCYDDGAILSWSDNARMRAEIARSYPGEEQGYDRFRAYEPVRFNRLYAMLSRDYTNFSDLLRADVFRAIPHLSLGRSLFDVISSYFKDEKLKLAFTFGSKYLGMSPWDCPGGYMMIPFVEHEFGIYHVMGGLCEISEAMAKVVREQGGDIRLNAPVKKLIVEGRAVKGVELESGERIAADEVIVNADFAYAMTHLVDRGWLRSYTPERLAKKNYSCSTFMLYLGVDRVYDRIEHHNILFSADYARNIHEVAVTGTLSADPSIYVQNATVLDPSLAPPGKSTIYMLVPVPNLTGSIDWAKEAPAFREKVLELAETRGGFTGLRDHIEVERMILPTQWLNELEVYHGATFNLAHNIGQMLWWRPHNRFEEIADLYLVGGGTHPGSGLPTIYESGRISSELILRRDGRRLGGQLRRHLYPE